MCVAQENVMSNTFRKMEPIGNDWLKLRYCGQSVTSNNHSGKKQGQDSASARWQLLVGNKVPPQKQTPAEIAGLIFKTLLSLKLTTARP